MNDDLRLTYAVPREMMLRAMRSWNAGKRRIDWGLAMVLVVVIATGAVVVPFFDLTLATTIAFVCGICVGAALFWLKIARRRRKLIRLNLDQSSRQGTVTLTLGPDGVRSETALSLTSLRWAAVDRIIAMKDATVLMTGGTVSPIPDAALPADLTPDAFRARLNDWRTA